MDSKKFPLIEKALQAARRRAEEKPDLLDDVEEKKESWLQKILGSEEERKAGSATMFQSMVGPVARLGEYHFPAELLGGCCPRIVGEEQDIVWNAAAEAADSERIHVVWQAKDDKVWYLAVRSSEMASHPNTWCPFASLLPGMKDATTIPACYTYYSDEAATMMTLSNEGLQIHRGTSSVVRAKAERTARGMGEVPIIELFPDRIEKLTPVPWYSMSLFEDRARRILAVLSVLAAIGVAGLGLMVWLIVGLSVVSSSADLQAIQARTRDKTEQLLNNIQSLRASPVRDEIAKFAQLNDGLLGINGWLDVYNIENNKVLWRAIVPPNITSERIKELGGQTLDTTEQGVVIGNSKDALDVDKVKDRGRR